MERLFVLKTLSRTQRATKVKKFVGFSLKPLRCRDPALPPLYGHAWSAIFQCVFLVYAHAYSRVYTRMIHRRGFSTLVLLINPRRACAARVTVLGLSFRLSVRLSVCLSVTTFSATTRNKAAKKRYQRVQYHTGLILKMAIFVKVLRSKVMA